MLTKKSASTRKPLLDAKTALQFEGVLRKALASSNHIITIDNVSGRILIMTEDNLSGRIITIDDIAGRQIMADDIAGRLSQKYLRGSTKVELDAGEIVRFYKHLLSRLTGSQVTVSKGKGSASKTKKSTKSKSK